MRTDSRIASMVAAVLVLTGPLTARASSAVQDVDLMARWTAATIVRYHVTAEFSGEALVIDVAGLPGRGMVTDRFEVEFDWNQTEFMLVGKPVIRNFPAKIVSLPKTGCPTVKGTFEHATVLELRNDDALRFANAVRAEVQRDLPQGEMWGMDDSGKCAHMNLAAARTAKHQLAIPAPNGMLLGMPSRAGSEHNGKSFVIKASSTDVRGWTFTVTPTIVK